MRDRTPNAALVAYWLGLSVLWGALTTVVIPTLVSGRVAPEIKSSAVALIAAVQAVVAIVVQPYAGALSDRLLTRWGRRKPWIAVGVALQLAALASLAVVPGYWSILLVMAGVELASNAAQGPYQGLLPDLVPAGQRGTVSGLMGGAQLGGQIVGAAAAGAAVAVGATSLAIAFAGVSVGLGALATLVGVREPRPERDTLSVGAAEAALSAGLGPAGWWPAARATFGGVWGRDLLERRDFLWLLASRLAILMAAGTLQPFILFYLQDALGLGDSAGPLVAPIAGVVALSAALVAVPAGVLTARYGRVRVVAISAAIGAVGALLFAVAPGYASLFPIAVPFGVALGAFLSADWALLADLVPPGEAGRYLGLSNVVTAGAGLLAVALAGPLADLVNRVSFGLGYRAIFALAAVEFAIGAWAVVRVPEPRAAELLGPPTDARI